MRPRASLQIRPDPCYRRASFEAGLKRAGYDVHGHLPPPLVPSDLLVIWNRYGHWHAMANQFEAAGARVIVAENGYLGRDWLGSHWYAMSLGFHNGAGSWPRGDGARWAGLKVPLLPWREGGSEIVVLQTRGIGCEGIREPHHWSENILRAIQAATSRPARLRRHPGEANLGPPLYEDLARAWAVVTWGSGAALKALAAGIPALYGFPRWIGRRAASPVSYGLSGGFSGVFRPDRRPMFEDLAWAMWSVAEIEAGRPFELLLAGPWPERRAA